MAWRSTAATAQATSHVNKAGVTVAGEIREARCSVSPDDKRMFKLAWQTAASDEKSRLGIFVFLIADLLLTVETK
ncbi:MAG: hypothetical protein ACLTZY_14035 [Alistipes indistinctus]